MNGNVLIRTKISKGVEYIHIKIKRHDTAHDTERHLFLKTSDISRTLVGYKIVDNSDVVGVAPVGAAPTTSSFST